MNGPPPRWLLDTPLAHRGLVAADLPENTLVAFRAAVDAGVGIELDVHVTSDGQAVVIHDRDLERLTGAPGRVDRLDVAALRQRSVLGSGEPVPTLREALDLVGGRVPVMVEIKNAGARPGVVERATAAAIDGYRGPVCVASFHPGAVRWFRRARPDLPVGQTAGPMHDAPLPAPLRAALARMAGNRLTRPDFVSYDLRGLPAPAVTRWRAQGGTVVAWTVTTPAQLRLASDHADNVIFEGPPAALWGRSAR